VQRQDPNLVQQEGSLICMYGNKRVSLRWGGGVGSRIVSERSGNIHEGSGLQGMTLNHKPRMYRCLRSETIVKNHSWENP